MPTLPNAPKFNPTSVIISTMIDYPLIALTATGLSKLTKYLPNFFPRINNIVPQVLAAGLIRQVVLVGAHTT